MRWAQALRRRYRDSSGAYRLRLLGIDTNADFGSGIVGSAGDIAESIGSIADDTQEDIKDKIKETEELFKKSGAGLAGFDKLNVLSQPSSDDDSEDSNTDKTAESAPLRARQYAPELSQNNRRNACAQLNFGRGF